MVRPDPGASETLRVPSSSDGGSTTTPAIFSGPTASQPGRIAVLVTATLLSSYRLIFRDRLQTRDRVLTLLAMGAMAVLLGYGAFLGGRLVYEFGVGGTFGR